MSDEPESFALTAEELDSSLWLRLQEHYTTRLAELRRRNDAPLTSDQTATLRGNIQFVKKFLDLGKEPPPTIDG